MANYFKGMSKTTLQPGARGEIFQQTLPGYRNKEDRINRSNTNISMADHETYNIKYDLDRRLPVLFRYGYAVGYNQIVIPKGRFVAIAPNMNQLDWDTHKSLNVVTIANGGSIVKLSEDGKNYETVSGGYVTTADRQKVYLSNDLSKEEEVKALNLGVDDKTGKMTVNGVVTDEYRPANRPAGVLIRNEYTRDDNAFNGMQPGSINTDCVIQLPMFLEKSKAEANPWGSVYGNIIPGDLIKSDVNGRFTISPLSRQETLKDLSAAQIEIERQQLVGQVAEVSRDLVPAGAAKYAQWALSDRMNFDEFNPYMWRGNYRKGEDVNEQSPYMPGGGGAVNGNKDFQPGVDPFHPTGFGYDNTMSQHDLHMLESSARKSDLRFGLEYQMENGIPGLTDGYNAVTRPYGPENLGTLNKASSEAAYVPMNFKTSQVNIEGGTLKLAVTTKTKEELKDQDFVQISKAGQKLNVHNAGEDLGAVLTVTYINEKQGFFVIEVTDKRAFHAADLTSPLNVYAKFNKRGLAGVPTFLDWDGCTGYASIIMKL